MKRLTTERPETNTEAMLNYAYAKDGRVTLRYANGEDAVDLAEYIEKMRRELDFDCGVCAADVMDGACMECDCVLAVLNSAAIQAAELRARLAAYEDTGYGPDEISDLALSKATAETIVSQYEQLEKEGRFVVLPCKVGDVLYDIMFGKVKEKTVVSIAGLLSQHVNRITVHASNERGAITEVDMRAIGKTVFLTREEAERMLEGGADHA